MAKPKTKVFRISVLASIDGNIYKWYYLYKRAVDKNELWNSLPTHIQDPASPLRHLKVERVIIDDCD